jgi:hypothetical protein
MIVYHAGKNDLSTLKFQSIPLGWFRE